MSTAGADTPPLGSISSGPPTVSTAPSSVTSEPSIFTGSPGWNAINDVPMPKIRLEAAWDDGEKLSSRELVASVPHDFPGKRIHFATTIPKGGNFESNKHFYARCCKFPPNPEFWCSILMCC